MAHQNEIKSIAEKYNAKFIEWDEMETKYSVHYQNKLKNETPKVFQNAMLNDIYRDKDKIYASFDYFDDIFFSNLIIELDNEQMQRIINETVDDYFPYISLIVSVIDVVKPKFMLDSYVDGENSEIEINTDSSLIIYGKLIDYKYFKESED